MRQGLAAVGLRLGWSSGGTKSPALLQLCRALCESGDAGRLGVNIFEDGCQVVQEVFQFLRLQLVDIDVVMSNNAGPAPDLIRPPIEGRGQDALRDEILELRHLLVTQQAYARCTGGHHRSVVIVRELENYLKKKYEHVRVEHRDIGRS